MAAHASDWGDPLNKRRRGGKWYTMVMMFEGELCRCLTEFLYYSYSRKPTGREFVVPAWTKKMAKLLKLAKTRTHRCFCPMTTMVPHSRRRHILSLPSMLASSTLDSVSGGDRCPLQRSHLVLIISMYRFVESEVIMLPPLVQHSYIMGRQIIS